MKYLLPPVTAAELDLLREKLDLTANLPRGIISGIGVAIAGAGIWAAISIATGYRVAYLSLGVGVLCGMAVRLSGKGVSMPFGVVGCLTTLAGCFLGNLFTVAGIISGEQGIDIVHVLSGLDYQLAFDVIVAFAEPLDPFLYTVAAFEGYRLAFRPLSEAELVLIGRRHESANYEAR